jgi:sugar phosphate isomerase/epimerase
VIPPDGKEKQMKLAIIVNTLVGEPDPSKPSWVILDGPDLDGNLRKAADWGYDGVELGVCDPATLDSQQIHDSLERYQLEMVGLCTGEVWGQDGLGLAGMPPGISRAAEERLRAFVDLAAEFGEGTMVSLGRVRGRLDPEKPQESWDTAVAAFRRLCDYAAPQGVRLTLEPVNHYEENFVFSTQDGLAAVKEVDRPNFGLVLDTYHMNIEDRNIYASFREARRVCWHVHVADNNRKWPGNAHIDFGSIVATLTDIGYTGYLSVEALPWPDPDTAGLETIRYMRRWVPQG